MSELTLHGYWRSSASYRVRIALALKGVSYRQVTHDLRAGAQRLEAYCHIAPHGLVPALDTGEAVPIESPAILEWIERRWPEPVLLPHSDVDAAIVRSMAALVACDIHPLANLRVLQALRSDLGASDDQVSEWIGRWIAEGFVALERLIARYGDGFAFGSAPTLADCYIVPQMYNAERFAVDLSPYPALAAAAERARALPAFAAAHPARQPDADAP